MGSTMTVRGASRSEDKKRFRICFAALLCFFVEFFSEVPGYPPSHARALWFRVSIHRASGSRGDATMNWQMELLEQASAAAKAKPKPAGKVRLDASATDARSRVVSASPISASAPVAIPRAFFRERRRPPPVAPR